MKDIRIALAILLILTVLFSCNGTTDYCESGIVEEQNQNKMAGESGDVESGGGSAGFTSPTPPDYTELALEVINGDWGNGYTRKRLLRDAGHDFQAVQEIVNEILD